MQFKSNELLRLVLEYLSAEQNTRIVFHTLEATFAICLLGNIIHLAQMEEEASLKKLIFPQFVVKYLLNWSINVIYSKNWI